MKVRLVGSWVHVDASEEIGMVKPHLVQVSLDGKDIPCVAADDEAGTVEEVVNDDSGRSTRERHGNVKIRFSNRIVAYR